MWHALSKGEDTARRAMRRDRFKSGALTENEELWDFIVVDIEKQLPFTLPKVVKMQSVRTDWTKFSLRTRADSHNYILRNKNSLRII